MKGTKPEQCRGRFNVCCPRGAVNRRRKTQDGLTSARTMLAASRPLPHLSARLILERYETSHAPYKVFTKTNSATAC